MYRGRTDATDDGRAFVDALREALGLEPLYFDPYRTEEERFARPSIGENGWHDGGRHVAKRCSGVAREAGEGGRQ
jgi:hypothetical protein